MRSALVMHPLTLQPVSMFTHIMLSLEIPKQIMNFRRKKKPVDFVAHDARDTFMGFRRANGSIGTRNYIAIVTSVNCSATAARRIADAFGPDELSAYPNVDGVVAFVHGTGCGMAGDGEGFEALQRVMWGYARHPNHAGVLWWVWAAK